MFSVSAHPCLHLFIPRSHHDSQQISVLPSLSSMLAATVTLSPRAPDTMGQTANRFLSSSSSCSRLDPSEPRRGVYLSERRLSPQTNYLIRRRSRSSASAANEQPGLEKLSRPIKEELHQKDRSPHPLVFDLSF